MLGPRADPDARRRAAHRREGPPLVRDVGRLGAVGREAPADVVPAAGRRRRSGTSSLVEYFGEQYPGDRRGRRLRRRCSTRTTRGSGADRPVNILVCVKRVPATGGRIVLTADGQDIDTRFLGLTISPHEECGVEEAVRIVEAQGGSSTVLTLGPEAAERAAPRRDGDRHRPGDPARDRRHRLGPVATAGAIADAIREPRRDGGPFDLILFGNEAADTGDFQVGIRVATALGRPVVNGVKGIAAADGRVEARREAAGGGWEVFDLPLPAVLGVKEGLNLPRYPSVPGRLRARKKEIRTIDADATAGRPDEGAAATARGDREPGRGHRPGRGGGAGGRRAVPEARGRWADDGPRPRRARRRAAGSAVARGAGRRRRRSGEPVERAGRSGRWSTELAGGLAGRGIGTVHVVDDARLAEFAPAAWAASLAQLAAERSAAIVIAAGSDRGNEVMAHVGARPDLPMAANVTEILGGEPLRLVRQRWAGSLLEDVDARRADEAADGRAARRRGRGRRRRRRAGRRHVRAAARATPTLPSPSRAASSRTASGVSLADARGRRRWRARRRQRGGVRASSRSWPGCSARRSACRGS